MELTKPTLLLLLSVLLPLATAANSPEDYLYTVCHPPTKSPSDTVPPCVEVETIETLCAPNGTEPIYLLAHQECMCSGSYFAEWPACQACLFYHGLRNEREVAQYDGVLSAASSAFCGAATPAATFAEVFSSIQSTFPVPSTGGTVSSDRAPSSTAVSLYYTASGSQGPGQITGAAAAATATTTRSVTAAPGSTRTTTGGAGAGSGSQTTGSAGAAGPGTKATTGPSGSGSASPSPSGNAAVRMAGVSIVYSGVVAVAIVAMVGLVL